MGFNGEEWKRDDDGNLCAVNSAVLIWGQNEDLSWHAEYVVAGRHRIDVECAFTLKELKRRLEKYGIKLTKKTRVPMP